MRRFALPLLLLAALVAACSSGSKKAAPSPTNTTTTTTPAPTTAPAVASTTTEATTTTTAAATASTTTAPRPTTTTTGGGSPATVAITHFSYAGANPVDCNAPTFIDLQWTVKGATNVEMHIDGGPAFTHYPSGTRTETLPLTCDGKAHTYTLWGIANRVTVKKTITVTTDKIA